MTRLEDMSWKLQNDVDELSVRADILWSLLDERVADADLKAFYAGYYEGMVENLMGIVDALKEHVPPREDA